VLGGALTGARRTSAKAALAALALMFLAACGGAPRAATVNRLPDVDVIVGAVPAESAAALYIAQERGIFAAHGLRVTIKAIASTTDIIPDMLHGRIDIASGQFPGFIAAEAAGVASFHVLASGLSLGPDVN
jgi:NitT/TauT family transport system substrate-binding protein